MAPAASSRTMPAYSPKAQAALLKAVNRVFEPKRSADSLDELNDGVVLGYILHELDPDFDPSDLEANTGTSRYLTNKRNIQNVYKGLFRFIRRQAPELGCQAKKFDYHAIAENPEPQGICQLLVVMLSAAAMGPDNQKFVPRLQSGLDTQTQAEIMQIIRTVQQDIQNSRGDDDLDEAIDAVMEARDIDLLVEEQNADLRQELDICKKTLSDYITRLDHLQQSHEELKYEKEKNDRELEVLRKATQDGANSAEAIKSLEAQIHDQMEIIARHEEAIRRDSRIKAQLESEVQKLTERCREADELRDSAAEWRHKAEELEKKANTAERYKQKIESLQHVVKEVQNLRFEKGELQDQVRLLLDQQDKSSRARTAEDELTKMITQSEQHLWDERNQKTQLMRDYAALEDEVIRLRARQSHDENFIRDLQDQIQSGASVESPPLGMSMTGGAPTSLEDELNDAATEDGAQINIPLELSRLKAENDLLRSTVGSENTAPLRRELDEEKKQRAHLQKSYNDIFEKHAVAQDHIEALINNMTDEGTKAFINLRQDLMQTQFELEQAKKREKDLTAQVADQGRDLLAARAELSALGHEGADALKELKTADVVIISSLKSELDHAREELSYCVAERDAQQTQLVQALLDKDKLRKAVEEGGLLQDSNPGEGDVPDGDKKSELIAKLRTRLLEKRGQLERSETDKIELQRKLKAAHDGEAVAAQKAASDQIIRNLERENALIATAWYDLTSRLQSNHVVLQRRNDAPRSWLNKQRQMVNGQLRFRDSLYLY
ncbi:hypothetical protein NW767_004192 [Fusarium falciforme]|uniref:HOOK N-terminal domain-containing protein n=1 Tax=Fusarium falciforme TaxID=195108 RepID=A0A9W8R7Y3_9HYPO|nr:hypothetical protein NW755_004892 [Fusarium falciforme]KAJ4204680.1 hypothetical protein NW767_004192 [Fusarium falciforme]KAJ4257281.1 hypothetical protein NW757_003900 [Fusarium falciforme]